MIEINYYHSYTFEPDIQNGLFRRKIEIITQSVRAGDT